MTEFFHTLPWALLLAFCGSLLGMGLIAMALAFLPRLLNRLTPNLDEEREIARGNLAMAEYFGRIVAAGILGMSFIIGVAIAVGFYLAFHS